MPAFIWYRASNYVSGIKSCSRFYAG